MRLALHKMLPCRRTASTPAGMQGGCIRSAFSSHTHALHAGIACTVLDAPSLSLRNLTISQTRQHRRLSANGSPLGTLERRSRRQGCGADAGRDPRRERLEERPCAVAYSNDVQVGTSQTSVFVRSGMHVHVRVRSIDGQASLQMCSEHAGSAMPHLDANTPAPGMLLPQGAPAAHSQLLAA